MSKLIKLINLVYFTFLLLSTLFFLNQYLNHLIGIDTFIKVLGFSVGSIVILLFSYKKGSKYFEETIQNLNIDSYLTIPSIIFTFLGSLSVAIAIIFIAVLQAFGILFSLTSTFYLVLNILALFSVLWLIFIIVLGWDLFKILGIATQYLMIKDIQKDRDPSFFRSAKLVLSKIKPMMEVASANTAIDLSLKSLSREEKIAYKDLIYPIKVWTACLRVYKYDSIMDSLKDSFFYYKNRIFEYFYGSNLGAFYLPMIIVPIGLSLGILISNIEYFSSPSCIFSNCIFVALFFLVFIALGFFFAYSIGLSLESAYYARVLSEIKEEKTIPTYKKRGDVVLRKIEEKTYEKIQGIKGNILDIFRIHFG